MDNWVSPDQLNLLCEPKIKIGLLGTLYFTGATISNLLVPLFSDLFLGRKWVVNISFALTILAYISLTISTNLGLSYMLLFGLGFCTPGNKIIGTIYLKEFIPTASRGVVSTLMVASEPLILGLVTLFLEVVDREDRKLESISIVIMTILYLVFQLIIKESPRWYFNRGKYKKSRAVLAEIAEFNGVDKEHF